MAEVRLEGVTKRFGSTVAVDNVTLEIPDGAFVVLLGPTGAGKTTTLRLVAGLERPSAGRIFVGGRDVGGDVPAARDVAMVFQQYSLYPHLTVRQNLEFPLKSPRSRVPRPDIRPRVEEIARTLQIGHKLEVKAASLSGGEMQRVSIGRALVREPAVFLMDEPLSSLDARLRADLRVELKRIQADRGSTFLYVTHDQTEAMTMATHVGVLQEGALVQFGTPRDVYEDPASIYVATRLGQPRINTLPATLFGDAPRGAVTIGLRPEHVRQGEGTPAVVERVEYLGDQTRLHLSLVGHKLVTLAQTFDLPVVGDVIRIQPREPLYFGADGTRVARGD